MSIANRGFASMTKQRRKEISAMGGRASAEVSHKWNHKEAVLAGRKGGLTAWKNRRAKAKAATMIVISFGRHK